jgi:hypothetical protein
MHIWSLHFTTWYSTLFASYIGYIHAFWWLLGIIHMFPNFIGLTLENQKTSFSIFFNFQGPKRSPNYLKLCGIQFFHGTRLWREGSATGKPRGPNEHGPRDQIPWPRGASPFPLVAPMSSIFVLMDSSWPKTDYKKGTPTGHEREHCQNIETRNMSLGNWRSEGKTLAGRCRCDLHPLRRLYLHHHDKEGVVHL